MDSRSAAPAPAPPAQTVVVVAATDPEADSAEALPVADAPPQVDPPAAATAPPAGGSPTTVSTVVRAPRPPAATRPERPQDPLPAPSSPSFPPGRPSDGTGDAPGAAAPEPETAADAPPEPEPTPAERRTLRIPPSEEVIDTGQAHDTLQAALGRATDDATRSAIGRQLELWARYGDPAGTASPDGRRQTQARALRVNAWWYGANAHPDGQVILRDSEGLLYTARHGHGFIVNPVATTGRWHELNADVPVEELAEALLPLAIPRRVANRDLLVWEYYDIVGDPTAIRPGISGMAQGRVALVMANAFRITGDGRFLDASARALNALTVAVDLGGARAMVRIGPAQDPAPWYVERANPGDNPWRGGALNGFMVTLLNLRGVGSALDRARRAWPDVDPNRAEAVANLARTVADDGMATMVRHLPDHDTGSWSYYGMLTGGRPWRTHVADLNYHCYHLRLLDRLGVIYPDRGLEGWIGRWSAYVDRAGLTCPAGAAQARRSG